MFLSISQFNWFIQIVDAIISHGCFLRECSVQHSIVGVRSRLEYGVELKVIYHVFYAEVFLLELAEPLDLLMQLG